MSSKQENAIVAAVVAVVTPVLVAVVTLLALPIVLWNGWVIQTVLRWHFPTLAIGVVPITVGLLLFRHIMPEEHKPETKFWVTLSIAAVQPGIVLFCGWLLLLLRGKP